MSLQIIPPVEIIIDIPDLVVGELFLKRKAELFTMTYNQSSKYLTLTWIVSYPDLQGIKGLSSYAKESIADNRTMVDVATGAILSPLKDENGENILDENGNNTYEGNYVGQYDWFNMVAETQSVKVHDMIRQYGLQADWSI